MRRRTELPELLSPAGSFDALVAAVAGGADAVYVGGKSFGARAFAKNFDTDELARAVRYCHLHGVKLYVTVNTLVHDREMSALSDYALTLYKIGVDAVICADLGAIAEIRRRVPRLEVHASTQMSVHNTYGVRAAAALGCTRVVPARELSLENIRRIVDDSPLEVEIFLHGALCVCHSGQCLMSSLVGGRSGNRGECAQPCRLPYNGGKYPLSLKDLSLAAHIPEIIESGVASLKIEGRMKSPEYVYTVTKIYRGLLDGRRAATPKEEGELRRIFSRDGFTDGYFVGKTDGRMTGVRSEGDKEISRAIEAAPTVPERVPVRAEVRLRLGEPSEMTLILGDRRVTAYGAAPEAARSAPLTEADVTARLSKMGNTHLSLAPGDIAITLDGGINLPPSALNALRRDAADMLESCEREAPSPDVPYLPSRGATYCPAAMTAQFFDIRAYNSLLEKSPSALAAFGHIFLPLTDIEKASATPDGVYIPPVIFDTECHLVEKMLDKARGRGVRYALVGNIGAIELAAAHGLIPVGDFRLNVTNSRTREVYESLGVEELILSPELTAPMARDVGGGVIVYGRVPLMLTERCFMRENFGCDKCSRCYLTDRTGARFPMMREFEHRNIIFNSTPTYMGDRRDELSRARLEHAHFIFSVESAEEIAEIVNKYSHGKPLGKEVRRMGRREK